MSGINSLYIRIEKLLKEKPEAIIAIDGNAASGKTSFASFLRKKYSAQVFHMDDFFLPLHMKSPERLNTPGENIDWERFLSEILQPMKSQKKIIYRKYDCASNLYSEDAGIKAHKLNIVEGVYSLNPNLISYYDLKVFITIERDTQVERILKRDGPLKLQRYLKEWLPLEDKYFSQLKIPSISDFVLPFQNLPSL